MKEPQSELAQLTDQSMPMLAESFATVAMNWAVADTFIVVDCWVMDTEMGGVMLTLADTDFVISAMDAAVIVTVRPPGGTAVGDV